MKILYQAGMTFRFFRIAGISTAASAANASRRFGDRRGRAQREGRGEAAANAEHREDLGTTIEAFWGACATVTAAAASSKVNVFFARNALAKASTDDQRDLMNASASHMAALMMW
jgi:hypothetical protein